MIYLTFGSVAGGLDTAFSAFQRAIDAVTGLDARVLVTTGKGFNPKALGAVPPNVTVESWVADQRTNAKLITVAGAGVVVDVGLKSEPGFRAIEATDVPRIRAAVKEVLAKSSYALAAQVIAEEIASTGSARDCLDELFTS